jgi:hypothetical protein
MSVTIGQFIEATRAAAGDFLAAFVGGSTRKIQLKNLFAFGSGAKCNAIGAGAGNAANIGDENTAYGDQCMGKVVSPPGDGRNTGVGSGAAHELTTGTINVYIGYNCGYWNTTGIGNTGLGAGCLGIPPTGSFNTALGSAAMENMDLLGSRSSSHNTAVGYGSMYILNGYGANYCTCLGRESGAFIQDSVGHVLIGYFAGGQVYGMQGSYNTLIGYQVGIEDGNTAHAIALGDQAVGKSACLTVSPNITRAYLPLVITSRTTDVAGFLGNSQMGYWLDDNPLAAVIHFVAKDSTGNVWTATLAMSR